MKASEVCSNNSASVLINSIARKVFVSPDVDPDTCFKAEEKFGVLPPDVAPLVNGAKWLKQMKALCGRVKEGKAVGLVESVTALSMFHFAPGCFRQIEHAAEWQSMLLTEVKKQWASAINKLELKALDKYISANKCLVGAVEAWAFGDFPWIHEKDLPSDRKIAHNLVLTSVAVFPVITKTLEEVSKGRESRLPPV